MHKLQKPIRVLTIATFTIALATVGTVRAYNAYAKWNANSVCYRLFLRTSYQSPTNSGASTWNNEGGANFSFFQSSSCDHAWTEGHIDGYEGSLLAVTTLAWYWRGGERIMVDADTKYDHDEYWWTSSGSPVPNDKVDMWSVAAHEFGHWLSLNHSCTSPDGKIPTMCSPIPYGAWWARTLAQDDKDGIQALYP